MFTSAEKLDRAYFRNCYESWYTYTLPSIQEGTSLRTSAPRKENKGDTKHTTHRWPAILHDSTSDYLDYRH